MKVLGPKDIGIRGFLIEYDSGFISPNDLKNKQIITEMKNLDFMQDLILYAVLQKYDTPNKNGRIYPESVLRRENDKYQLLIKNGGAINELNHPTCQRGDSQILTNEGWKFIKNISDSEEIYTLNEKNEIELKTIYERKIYPYNGKMIHLKGRNIDVSVTPNHNFPIINKNNKKRSTITAQEIFNNFQNPNDKLSNYYIPKNGNIKDINTKSNFIINGLEDNEFSFRAGERVKAIYKQNIVIPTEIFAAFMGIYLSEGCVSLSKIKKRNIILANGEESFYESSDYGYKISISQKSTEKIKLIDELMNLLPLEVHRDKRKNGTVEFNIHDRRLHKYLKALGKSHQKYIPDEVKNLHPYYLDILFKWFKIGDGRTIGKGNQSDVFSTSEKLINDLQEILIKSGGSGNIRREERNVDRYIKNDNGTNRLIKGENSKPMWFLNISKTMGIWLDRRFLKISEEEYNDNVYSVDVPNHIYYAKSNEKCHWTGNSSLIDLDRVSHSILETWWEGNALLGKLKLFTSPGWKKSGIISCKGDQAANLLMNGATLGISSRGVGSLKNVKGQNIVQEDFELVCFDLVSSPSTPGAYIFSDLEDRAQYEESVQERPEETNKITSLMNRLDNFLSK
jgi:hypothetical protein